MEDRENQGGWNEIAVDVEKDGEAVRLTVVSTRTDKILYRAKFLPAVAQELAFRLTCTALDITDREGS